MEVLKSFWKNWMEPILVAIILAFIIRTFGFGLYVVPSGSAEPTMLVGDHLWGNKMVYYFSDVKRGEFVIFDRADFPYAPDGSFKYYWQRYIGLGIPFLDLPSGPPNIVKRVIAIPGDIIEGRVENDKPEIYLNGKKLNEPYLNSYPLIALRKTIGFFDCGGIPLLSFLQKTTLDDNYFSYDSAKSYQDQTFYKFNEAEVVLDHATGLPDMRYPYTPTPSMFGSIDNFGPIVMPENMYWGMGDNRKNSGDSRYWGFIPKKLIHARASFVIWSVDSQEVLWLFDFIKHPIDFWTKHMRWNRLFTRLDKYYGWNNGSQVTDKKLE